MKTLLTIFILAMAQTANAQWSIEPGIGFVISEKSSAAVSLKGVYQKEQPFFFEGMLLHGTDIDTRDLSTSIEVDGNEVNKTVYDSANQFDHNAILLGAGYELQSNTSQTKIAFSVGGAFTKTNETRVNTTTKTKTIVVDPADPSQNITTSTRESYTQRWRTENVSPYMSLIIKEPINDKLSFVLSGTFYKTELHDVVYTNIGLNYKF